MSLSTTDIEIPFDQRLIKMFEAQGLEVEAETRALLREVCSLSCEQISDAWKLYDSIEHLREIRMQCELDFRTVEPSDIHLGYALFAQTQGQS
jgi:hypothetical protein